MEGNSVSFLDTCRYSKSKDCCILQCRCILESKHNFFKRAPSCIQPHKRLGDIRQRGVIGSRSKAKGGGGGKICYQQPLFIQGTVFVQELSLIGEVRSL